MTGDLGEAVRRAARPLAPAVAEALAAQNARLPSSPARDAHLAALRHGAAAVVTGQQVGLFLGPLYTLYKAATAVRVAQALQDAAGQPVAPVFWLQTEDHDLPEIARCAVPGRRGPVAVELPADPGERIAIAHRTLPAQVSEALAALRDAVGGLSHAEAHLARLARHYRAGAGWAAAFAGVMGELLADTGLVFIDPRDPALAAAGRAVHERALAQAEPIAAAIATGPVHVRPGAPLSFFHPDGPAGPRYRLEPAGEGFVEVGGARSHSRRELGAALDRDPLCFSTSALLRPILQDTLLPTAAYVGGPAEVAYFAQLPPLYAAFGMAMPMVLPRARFRLIDARARRLLTRLGLTAADAQRPEDELLARGRPAAPGAAGALQEAVAAAFAAAAPDLETAGPLLPRALARTRRTVDRAVGKLAAAYQRARLHGDQQRVDAVRELQGLLAPGGAPQERVYGLSYFGARCGDRALCDRVLAAVTPFAPALEDLEL